MLYRSDNSAVSLTLSELLSRNDTYIAFGNQKTGGEAHANLVISAQNILTTVLDSMYEQFSELLNLGDGYTEKALDYAYTETQKLFIPKDSSGNIVSSLQTGSNSTCIGSGNKNQDANNKNQDYMGFVYVKGESGTFKHSKPKAAVNVNNMAKAFLTFFADYMNGVSKKDADGREKYCVHKGHLSDA